MNPKVLEETPISVYDASEDLKKIKTRDTELNIRTKKLEEYLNHFIVLKEKEVQDLEKELTKLEIPRLRDIHIKKIIDVLPGSAEELKLVLSAYPITISKENTSKIVEVVGKYLPEEKQ